jgi:iron complex outermembrane receptor protein
MDILRSNSLGDRDEIHGALFGEAVLGGSGPLILAAGIRQDIHEVFGSVFSPSVSGSLRMGSVVRMRASAGRSYRAPTWTERYYEDPVNVGRDDLKPERAWSAELGMDAVASPDLRLSATAFLRRSRDLIDWARPEAAESDEPWETRNVENATFRGVELDLSYQDPLGLRWVLGGSILGVTSEEQPGFVSKYALRPLVQQTKLGLSRTIGESLDLGFQVQRAQRRREDPYHRVDLRGSLRIGEVRVYLDGENLLDASYPDVTGNKAPGRAFFLGLEMGAG